MGPRLTWEEIKAKYPNQWVGLSEIEWKNEANVKTAVIKYTDKSASDMLRLRILGEDVVSIFTTPDSIAPIGVVGFVNGCNVK